MNLPCPLCKRPQDGLKIDRCQCSYEELEVALRESLAYAERLHAALTKAAQELGFNDPRDLAFESDFAGEVRAALANHAPSSSGSFTNPKEK